MYASGWWGIGREREREREGEKENPKQAPFSAWSLTQGCIPRPWDHDLSQNQESDTWSKPPRLPWALAFLVAKLKY